MNQLKTCPNRPNCVCSQIPDNNSNYIRPLTIADNSDKGFEILAAIKEIIEETGGEITVQNDRYLHALYRSPVFRFTDDIEFRLDLENGCIHVRSASRLGYYDFGVNRKRVEMIRSLLNS